MIELEAKRTSLSCRRMSAPLTTGMVGEPVHIHLSSDFDGLGIVLTFKNGSVQKNRSLLAGQTDTTIPYEVMVAGELTVGVYATKTQTSGGVTTVVTAIPTIWCSLGYLKTGTTVGSSEAAAATPTAIQQFLNIAATLKGISSIAKTGTSGLVNTYTVTYTDGSTYTFTVTDGNYPKPKGPWRSTEQYYALDIVYWHARAFIAKRDNIGVTPEEGLDWMLLIGDYDRGSFDWDIDTFGGVNCTAAADNRDIISMSNMSSDGYPALQTRPYRRLLQTVAAQCEGMGSVNNVLFYAYGNYFIYDGLQKIGSLSQTAKTFAIFGDYINIFPDKRYYNKGTSSASTLGATVSVDGSTKKANFRSVASPGGTSDSKNCLVLDATTVQHTFVAGDAVTISGCARHQENNKTLVVRESVGTSLFFDDDSFTVGFYRLWEASAAGLTAGDYNMIFDGEGYHAVVPAMTRGDTLVWYGGAILTATVSGELHTINLEDGLYGSGLLTFGDPVDTDYSETVEVTVTRVVPDMDFFGVYADRLFGVKGQTVYACYKNNPKNWLNYENGDDDCWTATTTDGNNFTGACYFGENLYLFKEACIYKVSGTKPSNFALTRIAANGCESGSSKSFASIDGKLYYKSVGGFVRFDGASTERIDGNLGSLVISNAVAGTDGEKYYVSATVGSAAQLLVYDPACSTWHMEDALAIKDFCVMNSDLYMLDSGTGNIWETGTIHTEQGTAETSLSGYAEFGDFVAPAGSTRQPYRIDLDVEGTGTLTVAISYDGGAYTTVGTVSTTSRTQKQINFTGTVCSKYRIKITTSGTWCVRYLGVYCN